MGCVRVESVHTAGSGPGNETQVSWAGNAAHVSGGGQHGEWAGKKRNDGFYLNEGGDKLGP